MDKETRSVYEATTDLPELTSQLGEVGLMRTWWHGNVIADKKVSSKIYALELSSGEIMLYDSSADIKKRGLSEDRMYELRSVLDSL